MHDPGFFLFLAANLCNMVDSEGCCCGKLSALWSRGGGREYLLSCKVRRYCLLALRGSVMEIKEAYTVNKRGWLNVDSTLGQRGKRWTKLKSALDQPLLLTGYLVIWVHVAYLMMYVC